MTDLGFTNVTSTLMATRGERLVLIRARYFGPDGDAAAFHTEVLNLAEIDADNRIVGVSSRSTPTISTPLLPSLMPDTSPSEAAAHAPCGPSSRWLRLDAPVRAAADHARLCQVSTTGGRLRLRRVS